LTKNVMKRSERSSGVDTGEGVLELELMRELQGY
jgi:hypothetical protein